MFDRAAIRFLLNRWAWLIVLSPVVAATVAGLLSLALPPVWEAKSSLLVKPAQPLSSTFPGQAALTTDQISTTYAQLMTEPPLAAQVISDLNLKMSASDFLKQVHVAARPNTTILDVSVDSTNRTLARDETNQLVKDFLAESRAIQQQQVEAYTSSLNSQLSDIKDKIAAEQARIDQLDVVTAQRPLTASEQGELSSLQQQLSSDVTQRGQFESSLTDIQVQNAQSADDLVVIAAADVPDRPVSPRPLVNFGIAAIAGLILALAAALVLEQSDQSVRSDEAIRSRTGLIAVAHIPTAAGKGPRPDLPALEYGSSVSEAYRTLRTNLLFSTVDSSVRVILVTSPAPGEGKSRTAANLSVVLAEAGHTTLLIDADFRRPTQHRIFGRPANHGLTNLILQDRPESELVVAVDDVPGLSVLTSGPNPPNPSELLGSVRMQSLLEELRGRFDYVIIDSPPVNSVSDAVVLASACDAGILIVEHGQTTYPALNHAKVALERTGMLIAGVVVNKIEIPAGEYYQTYPYRRGVPDRKQQDRKEPEDKAPASS